jgi:hypothetical protein
VNYHRPSSERVVTLSEPVNLLCPPGDGRNFPSWLRGVADCDHIAVHDHALWEIIDNVFAESHPFAFLLYYCDTAQEYGRQRSAVSGIDGDLNEAAGAAADQP